jgi:hypothetical protein
MQALALSINSIDQVVKFASPLRFDQDIFAEAVLAGNFENVEANQVKQGSVIVVPLWNDASLPLNTTVSNLNPPQIYLLVVSAGRAFLIVEVVLYLYDNVLNHQPVALAPFQFVGPMLNGPVANRVPIGSRHRLDLSRGNMLMVSTTGLFLAGAALCTQRVLTLFPDGLVGEPGPIGSAVPTAASLLLGNANTAVAVVVPAPAAPVTHNTSMAVARESSITVFKRLLTRDTAPGAGGPGALTPGVDSTDYIDQFVGGAQGSLDGPSAMMSVTAIFADQSAGVVMDGRLVFESANISKLLTFDFGILPPTVTVTSKGNIISCLSLACFAKKAGDGNPRTPTRTSDLHASARELVKVYEGLTKEVLGPADKSIHALFEPLVEILDARTPDTLVLTENFIVMEFVAREVAVRLFNVRRILADPRNAKQPWAAIEALVHAEWSKFDIAGIKEKSLSAKAGAASKYGLQLPGAPPPGALKRIRVQQPAAGGRGGNKKNGGGGGRQRGAPPAPAQAPVPAPAPAQAAAGIVGPAGNRRLACAHFLAFRLGVLDVGGALIRDCIRPGCTYDHRLKPLHNLSAAERQQWLHDYGGGNLHFRDALLAAIRALP